MLMNPIFLLTLALTIIAGIPEFAYSATKGGARTVARLEGLEYPAARKIITGYGWIPLKGGCLENEGPEVCGMFPELINCTQGQPQFCILRFSKAGRCLQITTEGGYLEDNGGALVEQVSFIKTKCKKSL
jgi:hypothetical protein